MIPWVIPHPIEALKFKNPHAPGVYPLGNIEIAIEHGHLQLIYPLKMLIFHRFLYVYQSINQPFRLGQNQTFIAQEDDRAKRRREDLVLFFFSVALSSMRDRNDSGGSGISFLHSQRKGLYEIRGQSVWVKLALMTSDLHVFFVGTQRLYFLRSQAAVAGGP